MSTKTLAIFAAVFAVVLIASAAAGAITAPAPEQPGELVGQMPFGPEGGSQTFDNGAGKIKVPKGALSRPETIVVRRTIVRERVTAQSPTGAPLVFPPGALVAYIFGPINIQLNRPITIVLPLPPGQSGLIFVTTPGRIQFFPGTLGGQTISLRVTNLDLSRPGAIVVN